MGAAEMRIEKRAKAAEKAWRADVVESGCFCVISKREVCPRGQEDDPRWCGGARRRCGCRRHSGVGCRGGSTQVRDRR
ncbi:unnamed protein product [Camellia sinensis]